MLTMACRRRAGAELRGRVCYLASASRAGEAVHTCSGGGLCAEVFGRDDLTRVTVAGSCLAGTAAVDAARRRNGARRLRVSGNTPGTVSQWVDGATALLGRNPFRPPLRSGRSPDTWLGNGTAPVPAQSTENRNRSRWRCGILGLTKPICARHSRPLRLHPCPRRGQHLSGYVGSIITRVSKARLPFTALWNTCALWRVFMYCRSASTASARAAAYSGAC